MSLLMGFAVGAGVINALRAQGTKKTAYVIAHVEVTDQAAFSVYVPKVPETLKPYYGRIVVRARPIAKGGSSAREHCDDCVRQLGGRREMVRVPRI
jgi:hypothetical protein